MTHFEKIEKQLDRQLPIWATRLEIRQKMALRGLVRRSATRLVEESRGSLDKEQTRRLIFEALEGLYQILLEQ